MVSSFPFVSVRAKLVEHARKGKSPVPSYVQETQDTEVFWEASASSAWQQGKLVVIPKLASTLMNNKT